ncbi:hypothetical protein BH10ACI2_BH10ACI2_24330 [soil metagenome]
MTICATILCRGIPGHRSNIMITTGRIVLLTTYIVLVLAKPASIFGQPKVAGSNQPLTPKQMAKYIDMTCPIKGSFSVHVKKVGGMVIDKDVTSTGADGRFCQSFGELVYCSKNNPTPNISCKMIDPLLPRYSSCNLSFSGFVTTDKDVNLAGWSFLNKSNSIYVTVYSCDRAYKMDSCRYWYQGSAITLFENAGLFSVDKKISGQASLCNLDQPAETEYQATLKAAKDYVSAAMDIKRGFWQKSCPSNSFVCTLGVTNLFLKASAEAKAILPVTYDANAKETMKFISKKYDPLMEAELKKILGK